MFIAKFFLCSTALTFFIGLFSTAFPYTYTGIKQLIGFDIFSFISDLIAICLKLLPAWVFPVYLSTIGFFLTIKLVLFLYNKILSIWRSF